MQYNHAFCVNDMFRGDKRSMNTPKAFSNFAK